jgi:aspartyl aminopeptidase
LALHGVICKKDGSTVEVHIGEEADEPVFTIMDLLPHLARKVQGEKKLNEAIEGERMNLVIGGLPIEIRRVRKRSSWRCCRFWKKNTGSPRPT